LRKGPGFEPQLDHKEKKKELDIVPFFMGNCEMYTLYILHSKTVDRYYVGYTNDLVRRLSEHNRIKGKFTDRGIPWVLVYSECFSFKKEAMDREKYIKSRKSRKFITDLIS
jgi:putative endonuclease